MTLSLQLPAVEDGASSVEYGLLLTLIAGAVVVAVIALGAMSGEMFGDACAELRSGISATGNPPNSTC